MRGYVARAGNVEMILAGRQPITLTPERLKPGRPLPLDWNEQRELLLG
jgi:hypothetical protein